MDKPTKTDSEFIGFDLGHGETALGRAYSRSMREPEILEYRGERSFVSAVARTVDGIKIGADAVNLAALNRGSLNDDIKGVDAQNSRTSKTTDKKANPTRVWVKFKSRDLSDKEVLEPTQLFTAHLVKVLKADKKIRGGSQSEFIVGCPSGWDKDTRDLYQKVFIETGLKSVRVVPESRAALMTALEQGYLSLEAARSTVLIVDIGSSTTDFTYCHDLIAEDVGHNFLGSGLLDREIFEINLARQKEEKKITQLIERFPHYQPIMEYWCRLAKEQYFNGTGVPVEILKRLPIDGGVLFEIRLDAHDAKTILSTPLKTLNGFTWPEAFDYALKETVQQLGGRAPETVLLTGGASRLPLVLPACTKAFPNAKVVQGAEPEFAIARGLAWLGRFEHLHASFKNSVSEILSKNGPVYAKASKASTALGERLSPVLVDALTEACILPTMRAWRSGEIRALDDIEGVLDIRVTDWLSGPEAQAVLKPVITNWFSELQRDIEKDTDPLCREHGLPAMVLSLDDSQHISRHLEGLSVNAPQVASLESDTALMGTTLTAVIIGALLAKVNLFAPLFLNPIGLVVGGALAGGSFIFGRKALAGKFKKASVPVLARQVMTDRRMRKAVEKQRSDLISAVNTAWTDAASERFTQDLTDTLRQALTERADDRAVLFMI